MANTMTASEPSTEPVGLEALAAASESFLDSLLPAPTPAMAGP